MDPFPRRNAPLADRNIPPGKIGSSSILLDGLADPLTHEKLDFGDDLTVSLPSGEVVGTFTPSEHRIQYSWERLGLSPDFLGDINREAATWDHWAAGESITYAPSKNLSVAALFQKSKALREAVRRHPELLTVEGKRILDIGGSCKDSVYFLTSGAARIDQVEVSATSQILALKRLDAGLAARGLLWRGRMFFHTIPAERLPFADGVFDVVFSRSTIHHVRRPDVFREIHRVLKPAGRLFFIERYLSAPGQVAMRLSRAVRHAARGTDRPLTRSEIRFVDDVFVESDWYPYDILAAPAYLAPKPVKEFLNRTDNQIGNWLALGTVLGTSCWVAARK